MVTKIDVVIPTRNRGSLIANSLKSLQENQSQDFHVWVVDQSENTLTSETVQAFADTDSRFSLVSTNTKGADIARNIGLQTGEAPLVAFIDDDCCVVNNWVDTMLNEYNIHPEIDAIFGRVIPVEVPNNDFSERELIEIKKLQQILPMAKKENPEHHLFTKQNHGNLGFGHGANMSFRRSIFAKIGLFDEYLGGGAPLSSWEDRDIGYRILQIGSNILYSPDLIVYHNHWRGWPDVKSAFKGYAIGAGAFFGKYIRLGQWMSIQLLANWLVHQGLRQIFSGIIKWQSRQKIYAGLLQLVYPWVGLWRSRNYTIDHQNHVYNGKKDKITQKLHKKSTSVNTKTIIR